MVVPQSAIGDAFDVETSSLKRVLKSFPLPELYGGAVADVGGEFPYVLQKFDDCRVPESGGHLLSVIRWRMVRPASSAGKNFMFLLLLSTLMIPFPVLLIPTYEIFKSWDAQFAVAAVHRSFSERVLYLPAAAVFHEHPGELKKPRASMARIRCKCCGA